MRNSDPVLRRAYRRMLVAARHYERAIAELKLVKRTLRAHPDFRRTRRLEASRPRPPVRQAMTLAFWLHETCLGANDIRGDDWAPSTLREDPERTMEQYIATEEQDLALFARQRARRRHRAKRAA